MTFWSDPARLFPKQSHRWVISFGQHDENNSSAAGGVVNANTTSRFFAKSVEKPSFDIKTTQVKYMHSHTFNFPQRVIWNPITITLYDVMKRRISYVNKTITTQIEVRNPTGRRLAIGSDSKDGSVPKVYEVGMKESINEVSNPLTTIIEDKNLGKDIINFLPDPVLNKGQLDPKKSNSVIDSYNPIDADKSTQLFFYRFLQESGYFIPEEMDKDDYLMRFRDFNFKNNMISSLVGKSSFEQENSLNYEDPLTKKKFIDTGLWNTINITELNENGFAIETWKLYNPLITSVKSDKLDYTNEGVLNLTIGISYDWAKLIPAKTEINQIVLKTDRRTERITREEKKAKQPEVDLSKISRKDEFKRALQEGIIDTEFLRNATLSKNKEISKAASEVLNDLIERVPKNVKNFFGISNQLVSVQTQQDVANLLRPTEVGFSTVSEGTPDQLLKAAVLRGVEEDRETWREARKSLFATAERAVDENLAYLRGSETYRRSQNLDPTEIETSRNEPVGPPPVQPSPQNSNNKNFVAVGSQEAYVNGEKSSGTGNFSITTSRGTLQGRARGKIED